MISLILGLISAAITIYSILCFIDILLSWFPGAKFTAFGKFISKVCDPYLNLFSKKGWLRVGSIDFSPIISIGLLVLVSSILGGIISTGRISLGAILGSIISMIWNMSSSILTIFFIMVLVRWIVLKVNHGNVDYNSGWYQLDTLLQKFCYKVSYTFTRKNASYMNALLITWIAFLVVLITGNLLFRILANLCYSIPL